MRALVEQEIISLLDWSQEPISLGGVKKYLAFKGFKDDATQRVIILKLCEEGVIRVTKDRKLEKVRWTPS